MNTRQVSEKVADHQIASAEAATVLAKAVVRASAELGLTQGRLSRVLGLSTATTSRLVAGNYQIAADSKSWDLAILFLRLFRSLDSIVGTQEAARTWLQHDNLALAGKPVELIEGVEGLVRVVQYLDASRARI
ncbi:MAG: MbcA/ParS/Xre antitoxin family protein [Rhodocyclaceae bacterium]